MAVPKRKTSPSRRNMRRAHHALAATNVIEDKDSGEFRRPLWQDLIQIVNHGTQHRSEAAEALTYVGRSPGNLDISVYFQEKAAPVAP